MNKKGYVVECSQCGSTNIKYFHGDTTMNTKTNETKTPVKYLDCGHETKEIN